MKQLQKLVREKRFLKTVNESRANIATDDISNMNIYDLQKQYLHEMNSKINDMR